MTTAAAENGTGQARNAGGGGAQENPKRSLGSSPGPVIIESGRVEVESSRAESRQVEDKHKQASKQAIFQEGGVEGGEGGRGYVLSLCCAQILVQVQQVQGRAELGWIESKGGRKQVV